MTTLTKFVLRSGDRAALEDVVEDVRALARRKGAKLAGPHSEAPTTYAVPLYRSLDGAAGDTFGTWDYTVYARRFEISDHEALVRELLDWEFPTAVQVEVEIEQRRDAGR